MKEFIIVWFDSIGNDFFNDNYKGLSKSEVIKKFYDNHGINAVLINIIEI